jgi:alkanesulfonate monooxygenase SsuD/methylene tetrahydromethanopterin reductase-like flavin-dependent oxidoreductase (luciferase family)
MEKMREQMEAMKEIWTKSTAEYSGRIVKVPSMQTWPKPVQKPYPPILLGGAFPMRRAARSAMAMAGTRPAVAPTLKKTCLISAKWLPQPDGIRSRFR